MQSVREVRVQSVISCGQLGPLSKSYQRSDFQVPFLLAAGNTPLFSQLKRCKRKEEFEWHSDKNHVQRMLELPEVTFLALAIY